MRYTFDKYLSEIHIPADLLLCTDCNVWTTNINMNASNECIPITRSRTREAVGWTDHVKPERDRSVFLVLDVVRSGKPNTGLVYQIMKRTRYQYHYAVQRCKSNKLNIQVGIKYS